VTTPVRKIVHIHMDAFYASVEQRDDPVLRRRPVANCEVRRFGVRSAMPARAALRLCPKLVFVPPRLDAYRAVSREICGIFAEYAPLVEPLSLDEAYLDAAENLKGNPTAVRATGEIRARILGRAGPTASADVPCNKFLAKLASDRRKPDGQFVITPEMEPNFVEGLEVTRLHGVGPATAAKMERFGIRTGKDLRERPLAFLRRHFGKAAAHFHVVARGGQPAGAAGQAAQVGRGPDRLPT
jgi:DNA polymerase-4